MRRIEIMDPNLAGPIVHHEDWDNQFILVTLNQHIGRWWTDCPGTDGAVLFSDPEAWVFEDGNDGEYPDWIVNTRTGIERA